MIDTMAKKKGDEAKGDRHKGGRMVRIPDDVFEQMRQLADEGNRPITREIRQALIEYLTARDRWPVEGGDA